MTKPPENFIWKGNFDKGLQLVWEMYQNPNKLWVTMLSNKYVKDMTNVISQPKLEESKANQYMHSQNSCHLPLFNKTLIDIKHIYPFIYDFYIQHQRFNMRTHHREDNKNINQNDFSPFIKYPEFKPQETNPIPKFID